MLVVILAGLIILPRYESPAVGSANLLTGTQLGFFGRGGRGGPEVLHCLFEGVPVLDLY